VPNFFKNKVPHVKEKIMPEKQDVQLLDSDILLYSKGLLDDYATHMSPWKRFITGNNSTLWLLYPFNALWGRHHLIEVNQIRAQWDQPTENRTGLYTLQNTIDLLYQLHTIRLVNHRGSLARRINQIWNYILDESRCLVLTQSAQAVGHEATDDPYVTLNGLILTMCQRTQATDFILRKVVDLGPTSNRSAILQQALLYSLGQRREIVNPATNEHLFEDWHFLSWVPTLVHVLDNLTFDEKKSILLPAIIKAYQLNRTEAYDQLINSLFNKYPRPPSDQYLSWIRVVASDVNQNTRQAILKALSKAIHETEMSVPKAWLDILIKKRQVVGVQEPTFHYSFELLKQKNLIDIEESRSEESLRI
jgi:hypothetical protein